MKQKFNKKNKIRGHIDRTRTLGFKTGVVSCLLVFNGYSSICYCTNGEYVLVVFNGTKVFGDAKPTTSQEVQNYASCFQLVVNYFATQVCPSKPWMSHINDLCSLAAKEWYHCFLCHSFQYTRLLLPPHQQQLLELTIRQLKMVAMLFVQSGILFSQR